MRVLHAPSNIALQASNAVAGLRANGIEAECWHYGDNAFGFPADRVVPGAPDQRALFDLLAEAIERFDVFHFHYARSLVRARDGLPLLWDLPLLRSLGKKIVFTFHGSDVRKKSVHLAGDPLSYFRFADVRCDEERIDKQLAIIRSYAHVSIVAGAPLLTFVPEARYVPKMLDLPSYRPAPRPRRDVPLVVHVPSKRETKGTAQLIAAVEAMRGRGARFDFTLAERLPHEQLLALFSDADIVVDNLLLGDCEVSALEAMALARPVITRMVPPVRSAHPDNPAVHAEPDTFEEALAPLLGDARARAELGDRGRAYIEATHDARVVARELAEIYAQPPKGGVLGYPDWLSLGIDTKLEGYEDRIRRLEIQNKELRAKNEALRDAARSPKPGPEPVPGDAVKRAVDLARGLGKSLRARKRPGG